MLILKSVQNLSMKIILNPKYERLRAYMTKLEEHFENEGHEIHSGRNVIKTLNVDGLTLCVKRYAPPTFQRRLQQMIYKSSKGKQAYWRPMQLRERGFESPESIAYVMYRHGLWKQTTYFVCLAVELPLQYADAHRRTDRRTAQCAHRICPLCGSPSRRRLPASRLFVDQHSLRHNRRTLPFFTHRHEQHEMWHERQHRSRM